MKYEKATWTHNVVLALNKPIPTLDKPTYGRTGKSNNARGSGRFEQEKGVRIVRICSRRKRSKASK